MEHSRAEQGEEGLGRTEWINLSLKVALAYIAYCSFDISKVPHYAEKTGSLLYISIILIGHY